MKKQKQLIIAYLAVWAISLIVFWFFMGGSNAMVYSLIFLYMLIPITTFILSLLIGKNNYWGKGNWIVPIVFGIMYMLSEYTTFSLRNMITISFVRINVPHFELILIGAIISAIGLCIGNVLQYIKFNSKKK